MKKSVIICALLVLGVATAFAQAGEPDSLNLWMIDLEDVVVTAQYAPTDSRSAVHQIRTIRQEDIRQRGAVNLEQLLRQELNIRISQDMILGSSLNLQGISGQNVQIMIDGVPLIGRVGDDIDLSQVNLHNIERVEIVEGPLSVNYGTNALGGVINLITKKSQLHRFDTQLESQWESVGRLNLNATLGLRPTDNLLVRLEGGRNNFEGFNPGETEAERSFLWNPKEQFFAGATVRYDLKGDQQVRYSARWFQEDVSNLGEMRRPVFKPYAFDDYYHTQRLDHSLHQEGSLGRNFYLATTMGYNSFVREKSSYRLDFETNEQNEIPGEQDTTRFKAFIFRPVLASKFRDGKLNFQLGLDLRYENGFGQRIRDDLSDRANFSEQGDYAVFGSVQYQPTAELTAQVGVRAAHNTRFSAPVVPSVNLKYTPSERLTLRAAYARGFRAPSLKELFFYFVDVNHFILGNSDLRAETSDNFQLGLDWQGGGRKHRLGASVSAFYNDIRQKIDLFQFVEQDGELVPVVNSGSASTQYAYFNQSRYKTVGGNLRLNYGFRNLGLNLGLSPIGRYNPLSETIDEVAAFTYVFETNGELSYQIPKYGLQMSFYIRNNDKLIQYYQVIDDAGDLVTRQAIQNGFTLSDLTVTKHFWNKRIQLTGGVQNLFDVQNVPINGNVGGTHSGGNSMPVGMGRTGFARLIWQWGSR